MKKIILLTLFAVAVLILGSTAVSQKVDNKTNIDAEKEATETDIGLGTVKFKGIITDVINECFVDGICSIEVDNKWWIPIIIGGLRPLDSEPIVKGEVVGIVFSENNESIGKRVEIYAKKNGENSLSILGNEEYYVRVIEE